MGKGLICLVGCDGSGKSTLAAFVVDELRKQGHRPVVVWSRYNHFLSKPLLALARLFGFSRREVYDGVTFGYHDFYRSFIFRWPFIFLQAVDVNLAIRYQIRCAKKKGDVLVFERSPWDTLADVMLDTRCEGLESSRLGRWIVSSMQGQCDVLLIARNEANIIESRPVMRFDHDLKRKLAIYEQLCLAFGWTRVDNNGSMADTKQVVSGLLKTRVA